MPVYKTITERVATAVRGLARRYPDRVYPFVQGENCKYVPDRFRETGCIVGEAYALLGYDPYALPEVSADELFEHEHDRPDIEPARHLLDRVQYFQDQGIAWGHAVWLADRWSHADLLRRVRALGHADVNLGIKNLVDILVEHGEIPSTDEL